MKFDYYSATLDADESEIIGTLLHKIESSSVRPSRGMYGYTQGVEIHRGTTVFGRVWFGGNDGMGVHVQSSGERSILVSSIIREHWPAHRVSRADVAEDYLSPKAWRHLTKSALSVADAHGIEVHHAGDYHRGELGRTLYLGSMKSPMRLRIYEKGKQLQQDPHWVRAELMCRPAKRDAKYHASTLQPAEFFGGSRWTTELLSRYTGDEVDRWKAGTVWQPSDTERARLALLRQYGGIIRDWADEVGGFDSLGPVLALALKDLNPIT